MENEIFVVVGESRIDYEGEYHWLVSAWYYKDDAETHAARLNERLVVDPLARIGDDAPEYSVYAVALQPEKGRDATKSE